MSSIMRRRSGRMAISVIGGSCLEDELRTPRSSRRDGARTITRSPHAAHPERCPARSALPRERVRSLAKMRLKDSAARSAGERAAAEALAHEDAVAALGLTPDAVKSKCLRWRTELARPSGQ